MTQQHDHVFLFQIMVNGVWATQNVYSLEVNAEKRKAKFHEHDSIAQCRVKKVDVEDAYL
jgi:heme-binding NEAT domain protein